MSVLLKNERVFERVVKHFQFQIYVVMSAWLIMIMLFTTVSNVLAHANLCHEYKRLTSNVLLLC